MMFVSVWINGQKGHKWHVFGRISFLGLALAGVMALAAGCGRKESPKPVAKSSASNEVKTPAKMQVMSEDQAEMLAPFTQSTNQSPADKAWRELMTTFHPPEVPPAWQTNEPTKEEVARFEKESSKFLSEASAKANDFYTRFPQHERADQARKLEQAMLNQAAELGDTNAIHRLKGIEEEQLKNPDLTEDEKLEVRIQQLQRTVASKQKEGPDAALAQLDKSAREMYQEFPKRPEVAQLLVSTAQAWLDHGQTDKSRALAEEIIKSNADQEIKSGAEELIKKMNRVGKPLALKFTAIDGQQVDLQQMKGKVVLIDFWATWCRPCLAELPKVKAAYEKLHAKGFEIIGLSFDEDKAALEKTLKAENMTWPQHFDGEDAGKKWGEEFGITGIPTMWLVDKKGVLRELNAREELAVKVEKLLAE